MKNIMKIVGVAFLCSFLIISCERYNVDLATPSVSFSYSPSNPKVGDTVTFTVNTNSEFLSIFTGDAGHLYETSRVKALIENDFETIYDTVYRENLSGGLPTTWFRYMKDYSSLDEVYEEFELYGAIDSVDLGVYNDFPQALAQASDPDENVLKFSITDRRVSSGLKFKPNIHVFGVGMDAAYTVFEIRFVSCEEDKQIRRISDVQNINSWYTITVHDIETGTDTTASGSVYFYRTYETDDVLGAAPSKGYAQMESFLKKWFGYWLDNPEKGYIKEVDMKFNGELAKKGSPTSSKDFHYDFNGGESYKQELDPNTGLMVNEKDYKDYKGFQGDIYFSWIEFGTNEYKPFSLGESLGSVYNPVGLQTTYKYVYTEPGDFKVTVVGTNAGRKQYEGDGYQSIRKYSYNEYDIKREIYEVEVNVSEN